MDVDTGNFHVFFPNGCFRKKPTPRRREIFAVLDNFIQNEGFDMPLFERTKQSYLDAMGSEREKEAFFQLNQLITPIFLLMVVQEFSEQELKNKEGLL